MHTGTDRYCNFSTCIYSLNSLKIKPGSKAEVLTTANGFIAKRTEF